MSTLTSILALLKKSPTTDGADVFNLDTILNDNWDKLDAAVGAKYGVCGSAAATAAKTVTISGFVLLAGVPFTVKFTNGNSAAALTLNVSSTGAKSVKCRGGATLTAAMIPAGHVASLCYDGAAFWLLNPADITEKQAQHTTATATLTVAGWSSNSQTVSVTGVTANNTVIVAPSASSQEDYGDAKIACTAQGAGTLTFTCDSVPTSALNVNVVILGV